MIVVIDNYDSFTYNLVQYLGELGAAVEVVRNDRATVAQLLDSPPDRGVAHAVPVHAKRGRDPGRGDAALSRGGDPDARRLPRPPVARSGVRRPRRASRA